MDISIVEIGKYKVIRPISEGSAGRVYLVERDGKEYALKHLKDSSADTLVRFRRESSTLARLNNEHLTKIHDVGEFQERPYIVMDLLQGITLEAELARSGKLSQELSIEILRSVAKALTELHRNNLIHRDIKPSNIFITKTGSVRLIDLGLVGEVDQIRSETALVGTPLYCSPEQCRILKRDVDFRSDLYSLGVTAFTVLAGRPPYLGSVSEILQQHASKVAPSVIEFNSQVTRSLAAVIDKLLAKDPDDRYQSVMGLLADLERLNELEAALDKGLSLQLGQHDSRTLTTRVKYVERKAESEVLNQAWKAIVSGAPGAVIVTGVSGSGKSRLCEEFINSISPDRPLVLRAKCQFFDRDLPLGPIREALDTLLEEIESRPSEERQQGIANIQKAAQGYEDKLVSLTKSLIKILPSAKSPRLKGSEAEGDQEAFFNSIADFFARLCEYARPAVFFIDDLQWLDKSSQQLLQALFASERMKSFLLIATARDDDESRDYVAKIENLLGSHIKERLSVRPFDETQLSHLLAQYLGAATISQKIVHSIFTRSKGNPFIAIEYLRAGIEQGFLQFKEQTWQLNNEALQTIELADNVYDLIIRRIENSSENSKKVLQYAALCGNIVNSSDIQAVAGISAEAMNDLVDNCVNLGLAEKLNPSKWKFIHDKIPESLVSSIPDEVRRSMNDKLATFFFNKADKSHKEIFLVVRLFRAGNLEAHLEPALIAHKHAGEAALSNYAYVEAYDLFKFCFERSSGSQAKSEDMRLTMDLALCAAMVGDEPLAIGCADKAVGLAEGKAELAHALSLKTWILSVQSQPVEAWETFKWASSLIGHNYPVYMHWKLIQLVWTWMLSLILEFVPIRLPKTFFFGARDLDIQKVCGLYRDAYMLCMLRGELLDQVVVSLKLLTLGQLVGGMREKALGYACVCYCYGVFGLKRLAFAYAEKSRRSCLELNDPTTAALCEWRILMSFYMCGLIQDYRKEYLEKKDLFHKYLPPAELGRFIVNIANAYYITGLRDQALENYQFLIDLANKNVVRMPKNFVCTSLNLSWSCLALAGRQQESDRVRTVALEVNHELRFNPWAVRGTMIAEILAHRGTEELDQTIEQVTTAFWKRGGKRLVDPTLNYISVELTFIRFLQFKRARTQEERFSTELEFRAMMRHLYTTVFCPVMRSSYHYLVAAYALARGHLHQARKQYEVAEQYASDTGCLPILFEIQRDRARMHLQLGNLELMKLHLSSAIDLAARNNWRVHLGSLMKEFEPYVSPQAPIFRQSLSGSHHSSNTQSTVGVTRMGSMVSGSLSSGSLSAGSSAGSSLAHTSSAGRSSTLSATIMANRLGHRVSVEEMRFVDSLLNVTSAFVKSSNAKEQSAAVLSEIVKLFGAQRGFIFMSDDETGGLTVVAGKSSDGTDLEKLTGFSATVVNNVKETQKPMVVTGTEEGEALGSESAVLHNLRSIMATPLTLNETKGVVYLDSSLSKGLFTENDIELFSTLANHISVSFELSRMAMVEFEKAQLQKEYEIQHVMLEASQKVKVLVDNMQQALFSVDANGIIVEPVSSFSKTVFGMEIAGKAIFDTVFKDLTTDSETHSLLKSAMTSVFGEDELQWDLMITNFPSRVDYVHPTQVKDQFRRLGIKVRPLFDSKAMIEKVMFVVEDVTEVERLQYEVATQTENTQMLQQMVEINKQELKDFFISSQKLLEECETLAFTVENPLGLNVIARNLHTLKGNARLYNLSYISSGVHELESQLHEVRASFQSASIETVRSNIASGLERARDLLVRHKGIATRVLGLAADDDQDEGFIEVPIVNIESLRQKLEHVQNKISETEYQELKDSIERLSVVPFKVTLYKYDYMIKEISASLKKQIEFTVEGSNIIVDKEIRQALHDALGHLIRNSVDHGIELPDDRRQKGKPDTGRIMIRISDPDSRGLVELKLTDDGKGIDADKIAQSAIAKGFITIADADRLTQGEKLDLITIPGFSTEGNVTEISGRGVGMDAVKNSIEKVGGKLEILTQVGTGTTFRITFPSRLELEPSRIQDVS